MTDVVTDTHALIWYLADSARLGVASGKLFDQCDRGEIVVYIPTICIVEIVYLQEKGRIPAEFGQLLQTELKSVTNGLVLWDLTPEIATAVAAVPRDQVPDMPDRIIVATALHLGLPVISRDRKIQSSSVQTIW